MCCAAQRMRPFLRPQGSLTRSLRDGLRPALDPAASTAAGKINNRAGQSPRQPAAQHTLHSQESPIEMITMNFLGYRRPGSRARNGSTRDL